MQQAHPYLALYLAEAKRAEEAEVAAEARRARRGLSAPHPLRRAVGRRLVELGARLAAEHPSSEPARSR